MRILIAEQDRALGVFLQRAFAAENYEVALAASNAIQSAEGQDYDAAILDLNLSETTDLETLRNFRSQRETLPILVISARTPPEERAQAFDMGADDLIVKPFSFAELSARVRAMLRRGIRSPDTILRVENLALNRVERVVTRAGRKIDLTPKEFSLLEFLMLNVGQRVTRTQIIQHVWNLSFDTAFRPGRCTAGDRE
ncbi:MAG TPA: response regulator transcription factor [Candidatus Acidoferrales bacterium]|nr:response regulator transcription factor [Candidatus Acidoferrales bacterium]